MKNIHYYIYYYIRFFSYNNFKCSVQACNNCRIIARSLQSLHCNVFELFLEYICIFFVVYIRTDIACLISLNICLLFIDRSPIGRWDDTAVRSIVIYVRTIKNERMGVEYSYTPRRSLFDHGCAYVRYRTDVGGWP